MRVSVRSVGICGSDVHYYEHGRIGDFVLRAPMVLGHEAAGVVDAVGEGVESLSPGGRGRDGTRRAVRGLPGSAESAVTICARMSAFGRPLHMTAFWAEYDIHPAALTFRLPAHTTTEEGALMEPLAVGVHACGARRRAAGAHRGYKRRRDHRMCNAHGSLGLRGVAGDCG